MGRLAEDDKLKGRIQSLRIAGSKLLFLDVKGENGANLQIYLDANSVQVDAASFKQHRKLLQRGDVICQYLVIPSFCAVLIPTLEAVKGYPYRTSSGEPSLRATELPLLLSPCLISPPILYPTSNPGRDDGPSAVSSGTVPRSADPEVITTLRSRMNIIRSLRQFFEQRDFIEVQTPILAATAGGATARAFETVAKEFSDRKLSLRIAPELWLKRLVIGGMHKIFEIGPCFRNEGQSGMVQTHDASLKTDGMNTGLDKLHNPEFTTCEFYSAYTSLPQLMLVTEQLFEHIVTCGSYPGENESMTKTPFGQIDFIPALNAALNVDLPNLLSESAFLDLTRIFTQQNIPLPSNPTLPRLLDKLASTFLEPKCQNPTFIINQPECLSPLSKSFIHPTVANSQPVAARAELFIHGHEIVNCYE